MAHARVRDSALVPEVLRYPPGGYGGTSRGGYLGTAF